MSKIFLLEKNTRDQIAAGEVAERPALIIKELIENAIDAEATDIRIFLKESGIEEIRVVDNGSGMEKEDIPNAFMRHATSKIKRIEDLDSLQTMGFRGEALASIAAVSKITIRTKTEEEASAFECSLDGGEISDILPAAGNRGTEIVIRDLFFNTPARKKFLATPVREMRDISDIVGRIIIAYPQIRFELRNDGKKVYLAPGNGDSKAAIAAVYGSEPLQFLLPVASNDIFSGFISHPNYSKPKRNYYHFYINSRYIISSELNRALENAFKTLLPERRFPLAFINVTLPPDQYDINVHPNKLDVKFNRENHIGEKLYDAVKKTLASAERSYTTEIHTAKGSDAPTQIVSAALKEESTPPMPGIHQNLRLTGLPGAVERKKQRLALGDDFEAIRDELINVNRGKRREQPSPFGEKQATSSPSVASPSPKTEDNGKRYASFKDSVAKSEVERFLARDSFSPAEFFREEPKEPALPRRDKALELTADSISEPLVSEAPTLDFPELKTEERTIDFNEGFYSSLEILGQFNGSFIVASNEDSLYLIDQHAAHERLLFNKIKKSIEEQKTESQPLLISQEITFHFQQYHWIIENILILHKMGFVLEEFGENSFIVRGVPLWAENIDAEKFLKEFADGWLSSEKKLSMEVILERKIMSKACKRAVKANQHLTNADILYLFKELDKAEDGFTCPHGRPISVKFTENEIRRKFLRT